MPQENNQEPQEQSDTREQDGAVDFGGIYTLSIIGQIEGHYILPSQDKATKYEHILPTLVAVEQREDIQGLLILLNTVGGDVEAGLAIAEMIAGLSKPTVSLVLGGGHSIGVPLAVCSDRSFIAPSATMTLHPVRLNGLVIGVPQTFANFEKMQQRIIRFISDNAKIPPERLQELMTSTGNLATDVGTVLDGNEAVSEGIIDQVGSLKDALTALKELIAANRRKKLSNR